MIQNGFLFCLPSAVGHIGGAVSLFPFVSPTPQVFVGVNNNLPATGLLDGEERLHTRGNITSRQKSRVGWVSAGK